MRLPLLSCLAAACTLATAVGAQGVAAASPLRTIAVDERLVEDAGIRIGDTITLAARPGGPSTRVIVGAITRRGADPSEVTRREYKIRMHLTQLQELVAYEDRVDRFAVLATPGKSDSARDAINAQGFGFRAHLSRDVAVQTSQTFAVISRFNRAIGVISIVASAIFLLCIMLLKVEERRRDVAALRLLGISSRTIWRAVVLEASFVALLGSVVGLAFGLIVSRLINAHYQEVYRTPLLFSLLTPGTVAFAIALSVVLGIGAGGLAARRLTRRPPLALLGR
jgi:putative ABC transport system permease protein